MGLDPSKELGSAERTGLARDFAPAAESDQRGDAADAEAARQLVARVLERLSPPARVIITLLEIEEKSIKEISRLTGWSLPLVKVRAFRARAEMRKLLARMAREKYL